MRTMVQCAMAALLALALTSPARAADFNTKWSNGFKVESEDGAFKLKFGGRIQADYTFGSQDDVFGEFDDGFEFRRARLFFSGTIYERFEFKAQYDFAGGEAEPKDVYIGIVNDWGTVRFGHYKEHFSLEELTSSKYLAFTERSLPVLAFAPVRNSGVGVHGNRGDRFTWALGAFYDADDAAESTDDDNVNVTGRVTFRPLYDDDGKRLLHIGFAASSQDRADDATLRYRARPEDHLGGRLVDTRGFAADGATLLGLELAGVFGPFWFAGEYIQVDVDARGAADPTFDGAYVQAGYYLTGEHRRYKTSSGLFDRQKPKDVFGKDGGKGAWEIALRYSTVDLSDAAVLGGEQENATLAVNWYPNPATRLMINWVEADVDGVGDASRFIVRWQIDF